MSTDAQKIAAEALYAAAEEFREKKAMAEKAIVKDDKWRKEQKKLRKNERRKVQKIVQKAARS